MMASVSSAAGERRRGRNVNCARSIASAYSRRDRNCQPCAISTSSTPWPPVAYVSRTSLSAARTVPSPACGSSEHTSSMVRGRDAANRAASSSFASGLTADHDGAELPVLVELERAALGELEQRDEGGERVHDRRARAHDVPPRELLAPGQQRLDLRRRAFHVERARHHPVQHRLRNERDHSLAAASSSFSSITSGAGGAAAGSGAKPRPNWPAR